MLMGNRWMFLFFPSVDLVFLTLSNFNFLENNLASKANAQVCLGKKRKKMTITSLTPPPPSSVRGHAQWRSRLSGSSVNVISSV